MESTIHSHLQGSQENPPHGANSSSTTCLPKRSSLPVTLFECYPVNRPPLPSLPPEPTPGGWQPQGTTCFMMATGFVHPVEPQALLPAGYPPNFSSVEPQAPLPPGYPDDCTNYIADPACDATCLTVSDCAHSSLNCW